MEAQAQTKMTGKVFINKILSGTALGVIVGLIPNAVLSAILKYFSQYPLAVQITQIAVIFQLATPLIIGALAVVVTGGAGAYAYDKYETAQRTKIQEAYSNVKMNIGSQTNQNNNDGNNNNNTQQNTQNAKSQQEIRSIVAEAISVDEQNINFIKIKPKYEDDYAPQNNGVSLYVYKVEARANGLEYDVVVDAVSGKVLNVEIDD